MTFLNTLSSHNSISFSQTNIKKVCLFNVFSLSKITGETPKVCSDKRKPREETEKEKKQKRKETEEREKIKETEEATKIFVILIL